jgi:hypothetical protein
VRIPFLRGGVARLRDGVGQAPSVLQGYSGSGLQRRIARGDFGRREILAWRPYGLGSRFGELLNARRVATALGAQFVFHWPPEPLYDVDPVESVFGPDFIAEHHLPVLDASEFGRLSTTIRPADLRELATGSRRGARMAERYEIRFSGRGLSLPSYREAFETIAFHGRLERIREAVDDLPPIGLAVHLRRWDVAVPESRFGGAFSPKLLPLALIERIVADLRRQGAETVLLLGNDPDLLTDVSGSIGARTPHDLVPVPSGSLQEKAFRDFFLLARAERVLGGASAFARVAQLVAGAKVIRPETVLSSTEIRRLLWSAVMDEATDRPLEATLACDHLFQRADITLSMEDELALLERTVELDPEDSTRWLGLLVRRIRSGDRAGVERTRRRIDERFAGREVTAAARARGGMTSLDKASHLTAEDWDELVRRGALDERWTEGARGPAQAADPLAPSGS